MTINPGSYNQALDFIMRRELFGMKLGLENISKFLNHINRPQDKFRAIHIAGTNGKGSTAAMIESILREAGYKTGLFTSPHLADYRERINVNGKQISKKYIAAFVDKHRSRISRNKITFFETCTALAFCYFADRNVDIAIIEVGLGGRLDATNTLTPILSVITDISYDHTNILGETLTKIAHEKAGIIKSGIQVLTGIMAAEPLKEIQKNCREKNAPCEYLLKSGFTRNGYRAGIKPLFKFDYHLNGLLLNRIHSSLPGEHQIANAALAIRAVDILKKHDFKIGKYDIRAGLKNIIWRGRFEIIKSRGRPTIILDVGHNPSGVRALTNCFKQVFPGQRTDVVMGFVRNKNLAKSVKYIESISRRVEIVRLKTNRSAEPGEIASYFKRKSMLAISDSVINSVKKLVKTASVDDNIIVCGSHYAVGEIIPALKKIL